MLSPGLFFEYLDDLLKQLRGLQLGCHIYGVTGLVDVVLLMTLFFLLQIERSSKECFRYVSIMLGSIIWSLVLTFVGTLENCLPQKLFTSLYFINLKYLIHKCILTPEI